MFGLNIVRFFSLEDIRDILLRVAVNNRKPGTLHLDHNPVTFFIYMIDIVEINYKLLRLIGCERGRLAKTFSEKTAEYFHGNGELAATHRQRPGLVGVNVDQFDDPVGISRAGA